MPNAALLRPDVVARVQSLQLVARRVVAGLGVGARRSVHTGQAVEFADYKPYSPGDSLRDLDWRVLARRDRLVVRRYRAETEMGISLVLDASADLGSTPEKFEQALSLTATLAWLAFLENEPVGLQVAGGEGMVMGRLPARRGRAHLARIFAVLASVRPAGRAGLANVFREVGARAHPRGLIVLVGDLMEPPEEWERALDALVRRRADLRAVQVIDDREFGLSFNAPLRLYSPEAAGDEVIDPEAMRAAVREEGERFLVELRTAFRKRRGVHLVLEARGDLGQAVRAVLQGREARVA